MSIKKISAEKFQLRLNKSPRRDQIKEKMGRKYIPIAILESSMDAFFAGAWKSTNLQTMIVGNEICVSLEVHFLHPKLDEWLCRAGVGAAMIRQRSGSQITDLNAKLKNAMEMDFARAKAMAFKNAVKSIGRAFGRDLMRDIEGELDLIQSKKNKASHNFLLKLIKCTSKQDVHTLCANPDYALALEDPSVLEAINIKMAEIPKQIGNG